MLLLARVESVIERHLGILDWITEKIYDDDI
jgi:hypothetical protein